MVELQVNTNPDLKSKLIEEQYLQESNNLPIYLTKIEVVGGESFSNQFSKIYYHRFYKMVI